MPLFLSFHAIHHVPPFKVLYSTFPSSTKLSFIDNVLQYQIWDYTVPNCYYTVPKQYSTTPYGKVPKWLMSLLRTLFLWHPPFTTIQGTL